MPDSGTMLRPGESIETRRSWIAACLTLAMLAIGYGAPLLVVVGLKPIQATLASDRSVIALAGALTWVGTGLGGILMGWVADRIGIRATTSLGAISTACGLALSASGSVWALYVGHGLFMGFLGNGALYAPLLIYISRWFDQRRGTALALHSCAFFSGQAIGPVYYGFAFGHVGTRASLMFGAVVMIAIGLVCARYLRHRRQGPLPASRLEERP